MAVRDQDGNATYASILLADGVSSVYVQEQLGHTTIELTVSTYGRWLKKKAPGALDRLDCAIIFESGSKVVAEAAAMGLAVGTPSPGTLYIQALKLEPAIRIERTTWFTNRVRGMTQVVECLGHPLVVAGDRRSGLLALSVQFCSILP